MNQTKICMIGSLAVVTTSLVRRYVQRVFSEEYLTTIGVKIGRVPVQHKGLVSSVATELP